MKTKEEIVRQLQTILNQMGKTNKGTQEYRDLEMWFNALTWVLN